MRKLFNALKTLICVMAIVVPLALSLFAWKAYKYFTVTVPTDPKKSKENRAQSAISRIKKHTVFTFPESLEAYKTHLLARIPHYDLSTKALAQVHCTRASPFLSSLASAALLYLCGIGTRHSLIILAISQASGYLRFDVLEMQRKRIEELEREVESLRAETRVEEVGEEGWEVCD